MRVLTEDEVYERLVRMSQQFETQKEFGDAIGYGDSYVCRLLNRSRPIPDSVCAHLGVRRSVESVVTYVEVEP